MALATILLFLLAFHLSLGRPTHPILQLSSKVSRMVCPDGENECPSDNTCCKMSSGYYGCCPQENAVCCSDGRHCCPNGYSCDASGSCSKQASVRVIVKNVICPDGQSECPDGNTCCKLSSGQWGCCPQENAVCCSDGKHCCPSGYTCNLADGTCERQASVIPMFKKIASKKVTNLKNVVCPDGQSECPDGNTCCKLSSGQWGCCPQENAVCCSDGKHCCPSGYTCNLADGTCERQASVIPMFKKIASKKVTNLKNVVCPDGSECPDSNTCCPSSSGGYGCCPNGYPVCCSDGKSCCPSGYAVCCSDGKHCCPSGYTCNVADGTCSRQGSIIPSFKKMVSKKVTNLKSVICPDGQSECPDGNTCCKLSSGQWGCCPQENAVCCSDGKHCCPSGYTCNLADGTCERQASVIPMLKKIASKKVTNLKNVICPDGQSECPDSNTCCKLSSGQWGCCPQENAECCSDGKHCCPSGYTCNLADGTCERQASVIPMLKKMASKKVTNLKNVICPDGQSECPDSNTCCKLSSGQWGCCPQENAVCCSDGKHCCPSGYTCNVADGTCSRQGSVIPMLKKMASKKVTNFKNVICPDGQSECHDGNTCCQMSSGQWGCCPLPDAVCCGDGQHCCPAGYSCNTGSGTCVQRSTAIPMFKKHPSWIGSHTNDHRL